MAPIFQHYKVLFCWSFLVFSCPPGGGGQLKAQLCTYVRTSVRTSVATNSTSQYLWFWMRYLSEIFWRHSWDVPTLVPHDFDFLVCLSVCSLSHFLTEIRLSLDISSSRWPIFFKFSGDIPGIFLHLFIASLPYWYYVNSGYLQFWMS